MPKVLVVDDEDKFRVSLARRLRLRGYDTADLDNGEDAVKLVRNDRDIDVVLLDRKMPGMSGEQALREMKAFRPELQIIMLTAYGSLNWAMETGRLDAYSYMEKPTDLEDLVKVVDAAREDKIHVMARQEIPRVERGSLSKWLVGSHNSRPGVTILGLLIFVAVILMPAPQRLLNLLSAPKTGQLSDSNMGYAGYAKMEQGQSIAEYYSISSKISRTSVDTDGNKTVEPLSPRDVASKARVMPGILSVAALLWAAGAVPVGVTALIVGMIMYFLGVLRPDDIAKAYAKDAVIFIFGVLAIASAISKTGLDRRIGLLLLGPAKALRRLLFLFLPLLAIAFASSFAHMLIIGTPNNAIAYAMAKDPVTGEQLVKLSDFLRHGFAILILSFAVLWFWAFLRYWRFLGF